MPLAGVTARPPAGPGVIAKPCSDLIDQAPIRAEPRRLEYRPPPRAGGRLAGGRLAGGRLAGGRLAGGRLAGGRLAGGRLAGGRLAGGSARLAGGALRSP